MHLACGQGVIVPRRVQPAGKRSMTVGEFLRGHPVTVGVRFKSD
jgi:methionyl-tRNA formyltransferase